MQYMALLEERAEHWHCARLADVLAGRCPGAHHVYTRTRPQKHRRRPPKHFEGTRCECFACICRMFGGHLGRTQHAAPLQMRMCFDISVWNGIRQARLERVDGTIPGIHVMIDVAC